MQGRMLVVRVLVAGPRAARLRGGPQRLFTRRFSPLAWYNKHLEKTPMLTKTITSGILFGLGDVIAQTITKEKGKSYDLPRLGRAWVFGTFILGPLAHWHFNFLEYLVVKRLALQGTRMAFAKMFVDQFTYWAAGINCIYVYSLSVMEGQGSRKSLQNMKERIWPILKANWMLWPLAQLINFKLIPLAHQLNFVLLVSLGWASYLSWLGARLKTQVE